MSDEDVRKAQRDALFDPSKARKAAAAVRRRRPVGWGRVRPVVKVALGDTYLNDWPIASLGNSGEDNRDYHVVTNHLHADGIPVELSDAKDTAELICYLLNEYFRKPGAKPENYHLFT